MQPPRDLTIREAHDRMKNGKLTSRQLVESCLERIRKREATIHAWVEVYEREALDAAEACDGVFRAGGWKGPLHGIPLGIKDIIDVRGMWTRAGCNVYPANVAAADAPGVQRLRAAGAIMLGKTETTAFANNDPTITRNPWNPEHTPGGSSSGSGAAVADRMCLAALGSQTGGSLIRPAAFNGIVGFRPTYGWVPMDGVIPVSWGLDIIGPLARCVHDAALINRLMRLDRPHSSLPIPAADPSAGRLRPGTPPRLGLLENYLTADISQDYQDHLASVSALFESAGATVVPLTLPPSFAHVAETHRIIFDTELSCYHRQLFSEKKDQYPPNLRVRIESGLKVPGHRYVEAVRRRAVFQEEMAKVLSAVDAALMPASVTTAPAGLASTGSPAANVPWSLGGFPAISLPSGLDAGGLPFGVQLAGSAGAEDNLVGAASWCEAVLAFDRRP